jgi:hypothetical protein
MAVVPSAPQSKRKLVAHQLAGRCSGFARSVPLVMHKHFHRVYLSHVPIMEDGVAHSQFSTFERNRGDANGHQLGHCLHKFGVHWPEGTHNDTSGHKNGACSCSIVIQQGFRSAEGLTQWLPEAMRLANQVKAAEIWPEAGLWFSLDVI